MTNSKSKGKSKKLSINREALRVLSRGEAAGVNGGADSAGAPCSAGSPKLHPMGLSQDAMACTEHVRI